MTDIKNWLALVLAPFAISAGFYGLYSGWKSLNPNSPESKSNKSIYRAEIRRGIRGGYLVVMISCVLLTTMAVVCVVGAIMEQNGMFNHK
jgi:hypothetical protein